MKVIFTGAQGTGKSTVLRMLKDKGYPVITEVVRDLVKKEGIKINEEGNEETQKRIFNEYLRLFNETDDYVSDRGLIDVVAYTTVLGEDLEDLQWVQLQILSDWMEENPDVKVIYFPIEFDIVDDGVRSTNKDFQSDVDYAIQFILREIEADPFVVHGSPEERLEQVEHYINE